MTPKMFKLHFITCQKMPIAILYQDGIWLQTHEWDEFVHCLHATVAHTALVRLQQTIVICARLN